MSAYDLEDWQVRELAVFIEPMCAMRLLRKNAYSMDPKKAYELALLATDDQGYAESLWEKIVKDKMENSDLKAE